MKAKNGGKTQEVSRRSNPSRSPNKPEGLGGFRGSSEINGIESLGVNKTDSSEENIFRGCTNQGKSSNGKILKRLELVEDAFMSYVKGHQERLQIRLDESKKQEEDFLNIIGHLKQDIYDFVSSEENTSD